MSKLSLFSLTLVLIVGLSSCADNTEVGSGLLSSEDLEIVEINDFDLKIKHIGPTPLQLNRTLAVDGGVLPGSFPSFLAIGELEDPIFGKMKSSIFVRPYRPFLPEFEDATYDSVVLALQVDTTGFYGDRNTAHDLEVFLLEESFDRVDPIPTDRSFDVNPRTLGSRLSVRANQLGSKLILDRLGDSTTTAQDLLVIPLRPSFGEGIFNNSDILIDDGLFREEILGFKVVSTTDNALFRVDPGSSNSAMIIYYTAADGSPMNYLFPLSVGVDNTPLLYEYDITGSAMEMAIEDSTDQTNLYLQGHAGTTAALDISDILREQDKFINLATLEFFVNAEGLDTTRFAIPEAISLATKDSSGTLIPIIDLSVSLSDSRIPFVFGGLKESREGELTKYEMNITNHVKAMFDGTEGLSTLYLTVRNRVQNPNRVILYGPDHPTYPIKLNLTYTKS